MHTHPPPLTPELAVRTFEAEAAYSAALAELQPQLQTATIGAALMAANAAGFSWQFCPGDAENTCQLVLRHSGGAHVRAIGADPLDLVLSLLGILPIPADQRDEPEPAAAAAEPPAAAPAPAPEPAPEPPAQPDLATAAAASLAAATGGSVVEDAPGPAAEDPLTEDEKAAAVAMVKAMTTEQRKSFTISFRHAFRVPAEEKAVAPLIQQWRHLEFVDRFTCEAAGVAKA